MLDFKKKYNIINSMLQYWFNKSGNAKFRVGKEQDFEKY